MVQTFLERGVHPYGFVTRFVATAYGTQSAAAGGDRFVHAIHCREPVDDAWGEQYSAGTSLATVPGRWKLPSRPARASIDA